jgi:hypothetical protein
LLVRLLGGLVLWITTLYCGPKQRTGKGRGREGSGLYPELAVLGFSEGSSPALASRVAGLSVLLPSFQTAGDELERDGVPLNIKEVRRIALQQGFELLATRLHDLQRYRDGLLPRGKVLRGKRVGVAIDGGRVRTRVVIKKKKGSSGGSVLLGCKGVDMLFPSEVGKTSIRREPTTCPPAYCTMPSVCAATTM